MMFEEIRDAFNTIKRHRHEEELYQKVLKDVWLSEYYGDKNIKLIKKWVAPDNQFSREFVRGCLMAYSFLRHHLSAESQELMQNEPTLKCIFVVRMGMEAKGVNGDNYAILDYITTVNRKKGEQND